ncbi:hypothetical protein BDZ89DRAFT_1170191 [Hymenopellis radicata]|nr:hypothetical protein BDZ89DRAFT_1170191 [Hymenopellis radicata]
MTPTRAAVRLALEGAQDPNGLETGEAVKTIHYKPDSSLLLCMYVAGSCLPPSQHSQPAYQVCYPRAPSGSGLKKPPHLVTLRRSALAGSVSTSPIFPAHVPPLPLSPLPLEAGDNFDLTEATDVHSAALNSDVPNVVAMIAVNINDDPGLTSSPAAVIATAVVQYIDGNGVALATSSLWKTFRAIRALGSRVRRSMAHRGLMRARMNGVHPWSSITILQSSGTECAQI